MNLVWFRNDLRITDNNSLKAACENDGNVMGVYFFDPRFYKESDFGLDVDFKLPFPRTSNYRAQFIIEAVEDLRSQLQDHSIPLLVYYDNAANVLPELIEKYQITDIFLQKEWTRDELDQENELGKVA